jgi:uncharacterized membrane protein YfcA
MCLAPRVDGAGLLLLLAGVLAGIASTVVSLASLVSYPALLAAGLPPLAANVTNTVSLVFTGLGAAAGSRAELRGQGRRVCRLGAAMALGGAGGAALLLLTPARGFESAAPLLVGFASTLLLVQPRLRRLRYVTGRERRPGFLLLLAGVALYVGYFGAAGGILLLSVLGSMVEESLPRLNALKNVVSGIANAVAAVSFALFGPVHWSAVAPLASGFLLGGWIGPAFVRRLPGQTLRVVVGVCGLLVAARLGLGTYR